VRPLRYVLVSALLTLSALGCHRERCVPTCEQRAKELNCLSRACKAKCEELHAPPVCQTELKRFEACFLAQPSKDWVCDEEGLPVVRQSVCVTERHAVEVCLQRAPATPAPPR